VARPHDEHTHRRNIVAFINGPIFEDGIFAVPVSLLVFVTHRAKFSVRSRHRTNDFSCDENQISQVPIVSYGDV